MFAKIQKIHFVGIGGIGMSGIAEVLLNLGYKVSGSDLKDSTVTERLKRLGATIYIGHKAENVAGAEVVVTSTAIPRENPEVREAKSRHIALIQRAEMLAELMRLKYGIAVAGMHGKTTTTSMVASVLAAGNLDPTVVVGGRVDALGSNARVGKSQYLVAEADESDRSFLKLSPIIAVVTNIDREHMDTYRDMEDVEQTFVDFLDRLPFYGMAVLCNDDDRLRELMPRLARRAVTYGTRLDSDFCARMLPVEKTTLGSAFPFSRFEVSFQKKSLGEFQLFVPGMHNVLNAVAAVAVGTGLDMHPSDIRTGLEHFRGVDRRFQVKGTAGGVTVVDDYGHHPTEIRATLAAARQCGYGKVHVIFQPHRYTRTRDLMDEFAGAFSEADSLRVLDIYPASEEPIAGVTGEELVKRISGKGVPVAFSASFAEAVSECAMAVNEGELVLTLGAGNVSQIASLLLQSLAQKDN
ncbi:MAG TPA: UDP-N-acetylmuramate--L-alanine ligase [Terriglobales bacterium]|nr:UDP-N-acetylmuramate--L-alanine ligase [Terriglobales bacterium]